MLGGVFTGGQSRRMGGRPKGLLAAPETGEALVVRAVRVMREAGLVPVLVGEASPYRALVQGVEEIADDPAGIGPLGGLSALVARGGGGRVIAVACDMPWVSVDALRALAEHPSRAPVVAARRAREAPWEPFFARYDGARVAPVLRALIADGQRSFQRLFAALAVEAIDLGDARVVTDWDTPEDVERR